MAEDETPKKTPEETPGQPGVNPDYPWLTAVPGAVSILGDHGGVMDDDLFDILDASLESRTAPPRDQQP